MREITFGTDGWRAVIAEDYTFDNLTRVARATAAWVQQQEAGDGSVVIGYDTRFQGAAFARHVACVFASVGVRVRLADGFATTPAVSWATADARRHGRHRHHGEPQPAPVQRLQDQVALRRPGLAGHDRRGRGRAGRPSRAGSRSGPTTRSCADGPDRDVRPAGGLHGAAPRDRIDVEAIKEAGTRVAYDAMYGAGQGVVTELLGKARVVELGHELNPGMYGQAPEPIERNLERLLEAVVGTQLRASGSRPTATPTASGWSTRRARSSTPTRSWRCSSSTSTTRRACAATSSRRSRRPTCSTGWARPTGSTVAHDADRVQVHRARDGRGRRARRRRGVGRDGGQGPPPRARRPVHRAHGRRDDGQARADAVGARPRADGRVRPALPVADRPPHDRGAQAGRPGPALRRRPRRGRRRSR